MNRDELREVNRRCMELWHLLSELKLDQSRFSPDAPSWSWRSQEIKSIERELLKLEKEIEEQLALRDRWSPFGRYLR